MAFPDLLDENLSKKAMIKIAYEIFWQDFMESEDVKIDGWPVRLKHDCRSGKELSFWHIVSCRNEKGKRIINKERCRYIAWAKYLLLHCEQSKKWENERGGQEGVCIADEEWRFLVVLRRRPQYLILWTAYPLTASRRLKLAKEWQAYQANKKRQ